MGGKRIYLLLVLIISVQVNALELCQKELENNTLEIINIYNPNSINQSLWTWEENKEISLQVNIYNKNYTGKNLQIELFLITENAEPNNNFATKQSDIIKAIDFKNNTQTTINFSFKPINLNNKEYSLYAKLYDKDNETICTELQAKKETKNITIEKIERLTIMKKVIGPKTLISGQEATYTLEIKNIGNIQEKRILAIIYNAAFNLRQEKTITNLDVGQSQNITFNFTVPQNIAEQQEIILFRIDYDYSTETKEYEKTTPKDKALMIEIKPSDLGMIKTQEEKSVKPNQTKPVNKTMQIIKPKESSKSKASHSSTIPKIPYILILAILTPLILLILTISHYLKKNKIPHDTLSQSSETSKVQEYIKKINQIPKASQSAIHSDKPSEKNNANTNTPQPSQNPPQQPHSQSHPATTSSSPKSKPAKPASPLQAEQNQPQKNQPSPHPPIQDKPSLPQSAPAKPQTSPTHTEHKDQAATHNQPSSPSQSSNQTKQSSPGSASQNQYSKKPSSPQNQNSKTPQEKSNPQAESDESP